MNSQMKDLRNSKCLFVPLKLLYCAIALAAALSSKIGAGERWGKPSSDKNFARPGYFLSTWGKSNEFGGSSWRHQSRGQCTALRHSCIVEHQKTRVGTLTTRNNICPTRISVRAELSRLKKSRTRCTTSQWAMTVTNHEHTEGRSLTLCVCQMSFSRIGHKASKKVWRWIGKVIVGMVLISTNINSPQSLA